MEVYHLDVFTRTQGEGNSAGVVLDADGLEEANFREMARNGMLETAFILKPDNKKASFRLRFFSPSGTEMNLCAHATIGALYLLASLGRLKGNCTIQTAAGLLPAKIEMNGPEIEQVMFQTPNPTFEEGPFPVDEVARALNLKPEQITATGLPMVAAATGRAKLLVSLENYETLDSIELDEDAKDALCQRFDLTGLYPFTLKPRNPGVTAEARQFPYNVGILEDPVTGLAMGALGAYLVNYKIIPSEEPELCLIMEQGHVMGHPGRATVQIEVTQGIIRHVKVGGVAVIIKDSILAARASVACTNKSLL